MDENPWDTDVLGIPSISNDNPSSDSLNGNVWDQVGITKSHSNSSIIDAVPREEIIEDVNSDNHIEQDESTVVVRSEVGEDNQDSTIEEADMNSTTKNAARDVDENEEEDDDDDDDEFGSFEEQEMALPNFQYPINDTMETLFPNLPMTNHGDNGLKFSLEAYRKLTSDKRQFNQQIQNNYNRMNYWTHDSAMSRQAKDVINHWIELEQGYRSDVDNGKQQQRNGGNNNNTHALFNWSSKNDNDNDATDEKGKKFEIKSHQDQLLKIVADEISRLIDKAKQQELELQKQKWKQIRSKNLKNKSKLTSSMSPVAQPDSSAASATASAAGVNSKKKFSIGNFFKFNKKSSISKDHISSSILQKKDQSQLETDHEQQQHSSSSSRGTDLVDLVSEFEKTRNNADLSDDDNEEDEDEDDDDNNEMNYQYNNLIEDEVEDVDTIDESEPEINNDDDDDVHSSNTLSTSQLPPPPPPSQRDLNTANKKEEEEKISSSNPTNPQQQQQQQQPQQSQSATIPPILMSPTRFIKNSLNNNDIASFVIPSPTRSVHDSMSSTIDRETQTQIQDVDDDDDEFADFVMSPSPTPMINNTNNNNNNNDNDNNNQNDQNTHVTRSQTSQIDEGLLIDL